MCLEVQDGAFKATTTWCGKTNAGTLTDLSMLRWVGDKSRKYIQFYGPLQGVQNLCLHSPANGVRQADNPGVPIGKI